MTPARNECNNKQKDKLTRRVLEHAFVFIPPTHASNRPDLGWHGSIDTFLSWPAGVIRACDLALAIPQFELFDWCCELEPGTVSHMSNPQVGARIPT